VDVSIGYASCVPKKLINQLRPIIEYLPLVEELNAHSLSRKVDNCREVGYEKSAYSDHSPHRL
jgi:hypothetical protein